jgi:hypothetical protein
MNNPAQTEKPNPEKTSSNDDEKQSGEKSSLNKLSEFRDKKTAQGGYHIARAAWSHIHGDIINPDGRSRKP